MPMPIQLILTFA